MIFCAVFTVESSHSYPQTLSPLTMYLQQCCPAGNLASTTKQFACNFTMSAVGYVPSSHYLRVYIFNYIYCLQGYKLKPGFHPNATHATQSIALRVLRKRKPQATQAFDWLLRWLAVSIDHSYWLALACVAFEWKPGLIVARSLAVAEIPRVAP